MASIGVYLLESSHVASLEVLAASLSDEQHALLLALRAHGATAFVDANVDARTAGDAYTFVIADRKKAYGLCGVRRPITGPARVDVWVPLQFHVLRVGALALTRMLEFAFDNLRLPLVAATASSGLNSVLFERAGFAPPSATTPDYTITPAAWRAQQFAPALARLAPELRTLLDAEVAAGNEVAETGTGWPDADSVFVRLRRAFVHVPVSLPPNVQYSRLNDPHWWRARYSTRSPRHLLVW